MGTPEMGANTTARCRMVVREWAFPIIDEIYPDDARLRRWRVFDWRRDPFRPPRDDAGHEVEMNEVQYAECDDRDAEKQSTDYRQPFLHLASGAGADA
jgi:hypothetical protein